MLMPFRSPSRSILDFAEKRASEAAGIGSIIDSLAAPFLQQQGAQPQPQPLGAFRPDEQPTAVPQPLGAFTGPAMQPTLTQSMVTPEYMDRKIQVESGGDPNAVSPKGAIGLTQVLPSTAVDPGYGVPSIFDLADQRGIPYNERSLGEAERLLFNPDLNTAMGTAYATAMEQEFGGDPALTAAAYNAGPGAVEQFGGVPPYAETQNYVRAMTRGGAGGMGGGNVEDILATLYPEQTPEDARVQRRRDILGGIGQVFSALDTGATPDTSNIVEAQERRRATAVSDMRERERARAAASLVFSQTGDSAMASAIATGAIQYSDVLSQQQIKRAQQEADRRAVADAAASGLVVDAMKSAGIPQEQITKYETAIDAGAPLDSVMSAYELSQTAQEARKAAATQEEAVARNIAEAETVLPTLTPGTPPYLAAQRAAQTGENYFELLPTYTGSNKDAAPPANVAEAQALVDSGAINPDTDRPYTLAQALSKTIFPPQQQQAGLNITINPDGSTSITQGGPAGAGGGAGQVGTVPSGTVLGTDEQGNAIIAPLPGAIPPQQALVELEASRLALQQAQTNAPTAAARASAEAELAAVNAQIAAAELAAKEQEAAQLAKVTADQNTAEYKDAQRKFQIFSRSAQEVLNTANSIWATGVLGGVANTIGQVIDTPTVRSTLVATAKQLGAQGMLDSLIEAKAAGVTLTPVSNVDLQVLGASKTRLADPETLQADALIEEVAFQNNFLKDALDGPRDLTRIDKFGQPYKVGPDTLGVTPDTFDRHWAFIPPDVKAAWTAGELPTIPTDDPAYAEAANVINAMTKNYELYQGPLDRSVVGVVGAVPTDLPPLPPVPDGVDPRQWPELWRLMPPEQRKFFSGTTRRIVKPSRNGSSNG